MTVGRAVGAMTDGVLVSDRHGATLSVYCLTTSPIAQIAESIYLLYARCCDVLDGVWTDNVLARDCLVFGACRLLRTFQLFDNACCIVIICPMSSATAT